MTYTSQQTRTPKNPPELYEVQRILQRGNAKGQKYYLVKWKGYPEAEATWEPESNLEGCRQAILEFERIIQILDSNKQSTKYNGSKRLKNKTNPNPPTNTQTETQIIQSTQSREKLSIQKKVLQRPLENGQQVLQKKQGPNREAELKEKAFQNQANQNQSSQCSQNYSSSRVLQETTAQTSSSHKQKQLGPKIPLQNNHTSKKTSPKNKNQSEMKNNQLPKEKKNLKPTLKSLEDKDHAQTALKRQRQRHENLSKDSIRKKYKKDSIQKLTLKQEPYHQKLTSPDDSNSISKQTSPKQKNKEMRDPLLQRSDTEKSNLKQENQQTLERVSARYRLCEQQFLFTTAELINKFLNPNLKATKIQSPQKSIFKANTLLTRFLDLSRVEFQILNNKIQSLFLNTQEVKKLEQQGQFLYCRIQLMIKVNQQYCEYPSRSWICVLSKHISEEDQPDVLYFVRTDDMAEFQWRRMYRNFLLMATFE